MKSRPSITGPWKQFPEACWPPDRRARARARAREEGGPRARGRDRHPPRGRRGHARARARARARAKTARCLWPDNPLELYDAATEFARIFEASRVTRTAPRRSRIARSKRRHVQAMRQAIKAGFADREKIRTDARFAPLRETAEFQAFLKEVETGP